MDKIYSYYGEFGFLNLEVLGGLEMYFQKNPKKRITIKTYENYGKLLKHLFPNNIDYIFDDSIFVDRDNTITRVGHFLYNKNGSLDQYEIISDKNRLYKSNNIIELYRNDFFKRKRNAKILYLSPKNKIMSNKNYSNKYINIFPRNRTWGSNRNIDVNIWEKIICHLREKYNYKIVIHGTFGEFLKLKGDDLIYPKDILEQIYYLNNSILCISPNSGFAHFSLNCGCDTLVIDKSYYNYIHYNPFKAKLIIISTKKALKFSIIDKIIDGKRITPFYKIEVFIYKIIAVSNKALEDFLGSRIRNYPKLFMKLRKIKRFLIGGKTKLKH
jgi:hypothetical protein